MMKKIFASLTLALVCLTASAQFEAGKKYVNASFSGLNLAYSKDTRVTLDLNATGGYFLDQDWLLYGRLGYNHPAKHQDNVEIGLGGRYYIEQNGLSLGLMASYEHGHNYSLKYDHGYLTPEVAYTFFVNHYLTIEPAVYYKMALDDFSNASTVGVKVGLGVYF